MSVKPTLRSPARSHALAGAGAVVLLACLPGAATAAESGEPGEGDCPVVASAQGVQVMVSASDNTLLQAPSGAGVPVAQACVDHSVEQSSGFAGSPYPGETVVSAPALLRGQTGGQAPIPEYPLYAASQYPSAEKAESGQQGHTLSSHSTKNSTRAQARTRLGQDPAKGETTALAEAAVDPARRAATASATSDTRPWTVNGVLRLGQVRSAATATVGKDGRLVRDAQLHIGRTEVAGQVVEITPDGVRAAGQAAPLPDADPTAALAAAGVRVRYLREERTDQGVLSAGIEVRARQQDAQSGAVYTVHYVFGRAFAAAERVGPQQGGGGGGLPPGVPDPPPPSGGDTGDGSAGEPAPAPAGDEPADPDPSSEPPADTAPTPETQGPARLAGSPADMGVTGLYLVLAFGAVATFAFGTLLRLLGVRTRWTS